jgi:beta-galactosidase
VADSSGLFCIKPIQVAANINEIELILNGKSIGKKQTINGLSDWQLPFKHGANIIEVKGERDGKQYSDKKTVAFSLQPYRFDQKIKFEQLNILLGANRYFIDDEKQQWIPDQPYHEGSWGFIAGKTFRIPNSNRLPYGSDKSIAGTNNDPIYQTQQIGIKKYRFDLPAGEYELILHFAELLAAQVKELPYNLNDPERIEPNGKRIFNVYINGNLLLDNFDIAAQYGSATAVSKKKVVIVTGNAGIEIDFRSVEGEPVLNAVQVKKLNK